MFDKIKNKGISSLKIWIIVSSLVFLAVIFFLIPANALRWIKAGITIRQQGEQIEKLRNDIESLDKQIDALSTDRDSLEKFAREEFFFSEPDEDVFVVED